MYSTFFGLQIAGNALRSQQTALNVTGHNIANANTVGYSRQNANIETAVPLRFQAMGRTISVGFGSNVNTIFRTRDAFTDNQWRNEASKYSYWNSRLTAVSILEGVVNEPNQFSVSGDLDKFWNSWSQLAENPQNSGARAVVRERALTLIDTFRHVNTQLNELSSDMNKAVEAGAQTINDIAEQIKGLNIQIHRLEVSGDNPNDLKDMRDALVDQLSLLVPVKVTESQDPRFTDRQVGLYQVYINDESQPLVSANETNKLVLVYDAGTGFANMEWEASGSPLELKEGFGQIRSALDVRDVFVPEFCRQMDELANAVAVAVNSIHEEGQGLTSQDPGPGIPFFTDGGAGSFTMVSLSLNPDLSGTAGLGNIATGLIDPDVAVSDNAIALRIANLANGWASLSPMPAGISIDVQNASSLLDYYRSQISALGVDVQQAQRMNKGQEVLLTNASNQREQVSGVSLDEEMTNLMRFQKSYSAAARVVTMIDSMLENLLSMGVTR
ncbi:MAG: flagellar hook-associated protein FlgK [Peptococcaceae bacterium]|nr:flagellar hook-associated protein FlgK [Peptococcaceae bacterium]